MDEKTINIEGLSIEQAQELFDMVAINITDLEQEVSDTTGWEKDLWLRSLINYQVIYNKIEKALGENANDNARPDNG